MPGIGKELHKVLHEPAKLILFDRAYGQRIIDSELATHLSPAIFQELDAIVQERR